LAILIYVLVSYLLGHSTVPGFTFLAASIALFAGTQLLSLGIIGEYIARIHFRTMDKPSYVTRREPPSQEDGNK
jgi:undecaprenyl-phosphate 4-deoxy-4-formamido-L-arabinose transferase